jgi:DNA-binding CsgD family transcriptional regulator
MFTDGEIAIIPHILAGKTSHEIARILGKSKSTIDGYRERLYEKTGSKKASDFSAYCASEGLSFLGYKETQKK